MVNILELAARVEMYEDPDKLDFALSVLPLESLFAEAGEPATSGDEHWSFEDRVVQATLKWFKKWFKWVNEAECENCGYASTVGPSRGEPSAEDRQYGATVVEIWHCPRCYANTRFPRYNDPTKLLETRAGRCGEWSNTMHLILRALGRDVRHIWNSEDHVWNEVWSASANRWIHVDSCEAAFDKPLLYADGWGKKMAYVLGFSTGGARDVTKRYVRRPDAALSRTLVPEDRLRETLAFVTSTARVRLDAVEQVEWFERDEQETHELATLDGTRETLPARQSGSAEWTAARGENGPASA